MVQPADGRQPKPPMQTVRIQRVLAGVFGAIFAAAGVVFGLQHQWVLMALFLAVAVLNAVMAGRSLLSRRPRRSGRPRRR